jgi:hypothetical protein
LKTEILREQKRVLVKRFFFILSLQVSMDLILVTFLHNHETISVTNRSRWRKPEKPCKKTGFTFMKKVRKPVAVSAGKWNEKKNDITYLNS